MDEVYGIFIIPIWKESVEKRKLSSLRTARMMFLNGASNKGLGNSLTSNMDVNVIPPDGKLASSRNPDSLWAGSDDDRR